MISSIHFHPDHGCHETHGAIRAKWESFGFENGLLGYPKSDEYKSEFNHFLRSIGYVSDDGDVIPKSKVVHYSKFQEGVVVYNPESNTTVAYNYSLQPLLPPMSIFQGIIHSILGRRGQDPEFNFPLD